MTAEPTTTGPFASAVGSAAPVSSVPRQAKRMPQARAETSVATNGERLLPATSMRTRTSSEIATAQNVSVTKLSPGMDVVSCVTAAATRPKTAACATPAPVRMIARA